jgi:hypothetical protein
MCPPVRRVRSPSIMPIKTLEMPLLPQLRQDVINNYLADYNNNNIIHTYYSKFQYHFWYLQYQMAPAYTAITEIVKMLITYN